MMTLRQILVATDFSETSDVALLYGRELAMRFDAQLHVLHVAQDIYLNMFGAESYLPIAPAIQGQIEADARRRIVETLGSRGTGEPATVTCVLTAGSPALAIVEYAKEHQIDVIVMGTHGRGAVAHLLMGSVAERVVRFAPCPVLTVKHPERDFARVDALERVAHA
ncbi:MAG: universal stress protein [Vicinamibacterales bacterium]